MMPRLVVEKPREVERRRFFVLSAEIEARGHMGSWPGCALLTSQGEAIGFRERIGMTIWAGEARRETYKDRVAERKRVREMRRARIELDAGMCLRNLGIKMMSRWRFDRRTHLAVTSWRTKHEEKRRSDSQVNERERETTNEEQTDEWRKTVRFEQEVPKTSASSDPKNFALKHLVRGETPSRPGSVLVQKSFEHISALYVFYQKDGRESRCIGEVLERYRGEDANDLKRSEFDELVENWTCLNALKENIWKSNQKVVTDEKINPKILRRMGEVGGLGRVSRRS